MQLHGLTNRFPLVALLVAAAACNREATGTAPAATAVAGSEFPAVLATIGDQKITMADIEAKSGAELAQIETQYHRGRSKIVGDALKAILYERVMEDEARKQGKSVDELVIAEAGGSIEPSDIEISSWYNENQSKVGGRSLDQVRVQIADLLRREKRNAAMQNLQQRIDRERGVTVAYQPYRLRFDHGSSPSLGKSGAAVEVVEFSDFQCPYCRQFAPNLKRIEQEFGDKVRVVYRQYPIASIHPFAFKASEASLCANEQGRFWELHDMMFSEQEKLAVADLKDKARRANLDRKQFDACLDSGKYVEQVQRDLAEGLRIGVTGTPAVYINGIQLEGGAVPYETLAKAIRRELAEKGSGS
jgi:protein-disulfide isomerase